MKSINSRNTLLASHSVQTLRVVQPKNLEPVLQKKGTFGYLRTQSFSSPGKKKQGDDENQQQRGATGNPQGSSNSQHPQIKDENTLRLSIGSSIYLQNSPSQSQEFFKQSVQFRNSPIKPYRPASQQSTATLGENKNLVNSRQSAEFPSFGGKEISPIKPMLST